MTPKEKAKELLWKYLPLIEGWAAPEKTDLAKKLALVCVDECIKEHCHESEHKDPNAQDRWIEFWQNVKRELSLL